jgi:hypothetical protein
MSKTVHQLRNSFATRGCLRSFRRRFHASSVCREAEPCIQIGISDSALPIIVVCALKSVSAMAEARRFSFAKLMLTLT